VPPPPVDGAAVGIGVADGLPVADRVADLLAPGLALALGAVARAVPVDDAVGVAEAPVADEDVGTGTEGEASGGATEGEGCATEGEGSVAEGEDVVHAEIATEASMAAMPQPTAVSLELSPVPAVVRTFTEPPLASGRSPENAKGHKAKAHSRQRRAMDCSSLEY
jgi:hypothetical protein